MSATSTVRAQQYGSGSNGGTLSDERLALQVTTGEGMIEAVTENISANGILFTGGKLPAVDSGSSSRSTMPAAVMGTGLKMFRSTVLAASCVIPNRTVSMAQAAAISTSIP